MMIMIIIIITYLYGPKITSWNKTEIKININITKKDKKWEVHNTKKTPLKWTWKLEV